MAIQQNKQCNSYDVFDTLLARWYFTQESIFQEMEEISGFKNFAEYRKNAGIAAQQKSLRDIYHAFQQLTKCSDHCATKLRKLELLLESKRLFPVGQYTKKIKAHDIVISDMYLPKSVIIYLLKKNNIHFKKEHVYVSPNGKASGEIFSMLHQQHNIRWHTGDNLHADIQQATKNKICAQVCNPHFTGIELYLIKNKLPDIAMLARVVRLQNIHRDTHASNIWNEAADINLPILILAAIRIHQLSVENDYKSLLFAHRDCCHLIKIYKALYPECKKVKSFYVSRRCFYQPSKQFIDYAKRELSGSLLIDFAFSGRSALHFNQKTGIKFEMFTVILHKVYFRIAKQQRANIKCHYLVNRLHHEDVGDLEVLNLDLHGSVIDYTDKVIRAPIEYSRKEARLSHEVTDNAVSLIQQGFHLTSLNKNLKPKKIQRIVTVIGKYIYYHPCEMHTKSRIENASNTSKELKMKKGIDYVRHKLAYHFYYGSLRRLLDKKLIQRILFDTRKLTANGDPKIRYKKRERKSIRRIVKKS